MAAEHRRVLIVGGGTAGHTNPGIAVAEALVAQGLEPGDIGFVGSARGNESMLVPRAGFGIDVLPGRGIPRTIGLAALKSMIELVAASIRAVPLVRRRRPEVVLCLGGYAAFAPSLAARLLKIPVVVTEQNARASAVNRFVGRFATVCALPFPPTDLPHGILTGNPIRRAVTDALLDRSSDARRLARTTLGVDDESILIAAWAGSLGATSINRAVRELAGIWSERGEILVHHVAGTRNPEALEPLARPGVLRYRTVPYEHDMPTLLLAADIAVTRGGASTVAELSVAALPAAIVPLPGAPRDHQRANAEELASIGRAIILDDSRLSGAYLAEELEPLLDGAVRRQMRLAPPNVDHARAADAVAQLVVAHLQDSARS